MNDNIKLLDAAIRSNNKKEVKKILKSKFIDISYRCNEPLLIACENGFLDIVKLLIKHESIKLRDPNFPMLAAVANNQYKIVRFLLTDKRISACGNEFLSLKNAFNNKLYDITLLLITDPTVKENLIEFELELYHEISKTLEPLKIKNKIKKF